MRFFAAAREAVGRSTDSVPGATVAEVLDVAVARYGDTFAAVLASSRIWVNGEEVDASCVLLDTDELAVLPPVSGGSE